MPLKTEISKERGTQHDASARQAEAMPRDNGAQEHTNQLSDRNRRSLKVLQMVFSRSTGIGNLHMSTGWLKARFTPAGDLLGKILWMNFRAGRNPI